MRRSPAILQMAPRRGLLAQRQQWPTMTFPSGRCATLASASISVRVCGRDAPVLPDAIEVHDAQRCKECYM